MTTPITETGRHISIRPAKRGIRIDIRIKSDITAFELAQILSSVELFSLDRVGAIKDVFYKPLPQFFYVHKDDMAIFRSADPINRHFLIEDR